MSETLTVSEGLRKPFPAEQTGKLPRVTCPRCSDRNCGDHEKRKCEVCKAYVSERHIHIDYVGHADVTSRLLDVDSQWNWEPKTKDIDPAVLAAAIATGNPEIVQAVFDNAPPKFDLDNKGNPVGLWIKLTVGGVTRLGFGSCPSNQNDAVKVLIGDALRNSAMRFGVALGLWAKGDRADPTAENATASAGKASRSGGRRESFDDAAPAPRRDQPGSNGHTVRPAASAPSAAASGEPDPDAQPFADEACEARTAAVLAEVNRRAREAHKLAALIRNPGTGGVGGLGQYINWRKKQLEDADAALAELNLAADGAGLGADELDARVKELTGAGIEDATAAQLRDAAGKLAMAGAPA